ncbi:MAG TPA: hypothetical protein ACFCUD_06340 [Cyclobacteriaceae bacterium]
MNIRKYFLSLFLLFGLLFCHAEDKKTEKLTATEAQRLIERVEEIKSMSMSKLKKSERKVLKKELKEIKKTLKTQGFLTNRLSISVGALIIIILVLIIVL